MTTTLGPVATPDTTGPGTRARAPGPELDGDVVGAAPRAPDPRAGTHPPRHRYGRQAAVVLLALGAVALVVVTRRHALSASVTLLGHLRWVWLPLALGLEWASMSAFARMQCRLLRAGGTTVATGTMLATVYAANALSVSVPLAGPELGAAFSFRRFTRQGVDPSLAGWAVMVGGVVSPVAGVFVFAGGALLSGNDLLAIAGSLAGVLGAVAVVVVHSATRHPRLRRAMEPPAAWIVGRARRLRRRPVEDPAADVGAWADRLAALRPDCSVWTSVSGLALANWLTDAGVLAASIYAVGAAVPWQALLLVYGSGVVVRSLGLTPGGLGLVEGTLCLGLVGAGLHVGQALASVLLYRLISFWLLAAAGWVVFVYLRRDRHLAPSVIGSTAS